MTYLFLQKTMPQPILYSWREIQRIAAMIAMQTKSELAPNPKSSISKTDMKTPGILGICKQMWAVKTDFF